MLETPHAIIGASLATKIPNPLISLPLALGSHFVLDKIPHWNPHLNTETKRYGKVTRKTTAIVALDISFAFVSILFIASRATSEHQFVIIILGAFLGILPDLVEGPYFFLNWKSKLVERWIRFQKSIQVDTSLIPGLLTQLVTIAASLLWIYF